MHENKIKKIIGPWAHLGPGPTWARVPLGPGFHLGPGPTREHTSFVSLDTNGVEMARHGLILWENDATGLKIILEWFPGLYNLFKKTKIDKKT